MTRIIYSIEENWSLSNEEVRHLDVTISLQLVGSLSDSQYVLEKSYGFAFVSCIASLDFLEVFQVLKEHLRIKLHLGIGRSGMAGTLQCLYSKAETWPNTHFSPKPRYSPAFQAIV